MTTTLPNQSDANATSPAWRPWLGVAVLIATMTVMRIVYACVLDLRTDEAYYWTWSKESALSFLDHPPMIAWFIRFGTAIFGDTNFGVRFAGLLAMLVTQLLLADIVRRVTHDVRAIVFMPFNPHSLFNRPVVLPEQARVTLRLPNASAILTCDGQQNADLEPGAEVQIAAPGLAVELVRWPLKFQLPEPLETSSAYSWLRSMPPPNCKRCRPRV